MSDYERGLQAADRSTARKYAREFREKLAAFLAEQPEHRWCEMHRWPCALVSHSCPQGVYTDDCHLVPARIVVTP